MTDVTSTSTTPETPDTANSVHPAILEALAKLGRRAHLPEDLKAISDKFYELGEWIVNHTYHGPGTIIALNKLFESKNETVSQHKTTQEKNDAQAAAASTPQQ